jgi:hypothetical protein
MARPPPSGLSGLGGISVYTRYVPGGMQKARTNPIVRLQRLNPAQRRLLIRACVVLSAAAAAVALLPFRRAIRFGCVPQRPGSRVEIADCVWAIEAAARRLPWRTLCIEQGLAAQRMLRRAGCDAVLHYGARQNRASGQLEAHVWVSVDDRTVIGGEEASGFAHVAAYP